MLYVHGLGHFHPPNELTNAFLEELDIGTTRASSGSATPPEPRRRR